MYSSVSDPARPLATQPNPASRPPMSTRSLGPNRSTSCPSKGTSQVSSSTNTVKVTWIADWSTLNVFCSGGTNNVQPYWKLATATMLRTLKKRISQRLSKSDDPAACRELLSAMVTPPIGMRVPTSGTRSRGAGEHASGTKSNAKAKVLVSPTPVDDLRQVASGTE